MNMPDNYAYQAEVLKVVDGDTIDVLIRWDIGFKVTCETVQRLRFARINAPETRGEEREMGLVAKKFVIERLEKVDKIVIYTSKGDAFGRYIAEIYVPNDDGYAEHVAGIGALGEFYNLNDLMVAEGCAEYRDY